jgi:hypothetical protein
MIVTARGFSIATLISGAMGAISYVLVRGFAHTQLSAIGLIMVLPYNISMTLAFPFVVIEAGICLYSIRTRDLFLLALSALTINLVVVVSLFKGWPHSPH